MDGKNVVAVNDKHDHSALLEEAVLLVRAVLKIECPILHISQLHTLPDVSLYLLPFFEGETFDLVDKKRVPIIGPAAIIFLLKQEILLPRRLKNGLNIYSLSLHGTRVCCSNIDKESRDKLYEKVIAMGGSTNTNLTSDVTHLVVAEVGSMKYQYAVKLGIPIMSPDWITAMWEKSKTQVVKNDAALTDQYKCAPFQGCTLCVTGLDVAQRTEVETLTKQHGGTYSGDLVMDKCTHLLADSPQGQKFNFAMKWRIPCVRSKWFYDSINKGVCLDLKEYQHVCNKENTSHEASYLVRPMLEETRDCTGIQGVLQQLNNLDVTLNKDKGYLDGCRIFLSGFSAVEQDQLKKIINNGGGMRLDAISSRVTHIVTKTSVIKELEQLKSTQPEAAVVSLQWLTSSMEKGVQQPEQQFNLLPSTGVTLDNPLPTIRPAKQDDGDAILNQYKANAGDVTTQQNDVTTQPCDVTTQQNDVTMTTGDVTKVNSTVNRTRAHIISASQCSGLFKGYTFYVDSGISKKVARNVQQQIISHGGACRNDNVDFCIVDPFLDQPSCFPDKTHVTYMWLQRCIQRMDLLSVTDCVLFTPRLVPRPCPVLQGCVVCYTQFSGFELAHLCAVVELLGGVCQGTLTKKAIKDSRKMPDSLPCTHLLYKSKENSPKLDAAVMWRIPCVTIDWLYECLTTLRKVDTAEYESNVVIKPDKVALVTATQRIADELPSKVAALTVTTSVFLKHDKDGFITPVKPRSKIKVEGVLEALESPACSETSRQSLGGLSSLYKKNILNAMRKTAPPTKIFGGVTLVVKQAKPEVPVSEIKTAARRNGAVVKAYIDRTCTHVVCSVKEVKEGNMEQAVKQGVKLVSCYWVLMSDEQKKRLSEQEYSPGYDPKRALNISVSEDVEVAAVDIDNTQSEQVPLGDDNAFSLDPNLKKEISMLEKISASEESKESSGFTAPGTPRSKRNKRSTLAPRKMTPLDVPMEELMSQVPVSVTYEDGKDAREAFLARKEAEAKRLSEQGSPKVEAVGGPVPDDTLNNSSIPNVNLAPASSSTPNRNTEVNKLSETEVQEIIKGINPDDLELSDLTMDNTDIETPAPAPLTVKHFLLTGIPPGEKVEFASVIKELGGVVISSSNFDTSCTHLVANSPSRNEKFLAGIGSGTWVLHPQYLTVSKDLGGWAEESQYVWANFADTLIGTNKSLALCTSHWVGKKAFKDWSVMLCAAPKYRQVMVFKGIIESGGGTVIQYKRPYSVQSSITHALFDTNATGLDPEVPLKALVEAGIHCLKLEYIPEHMITEGTDEKLVDYVIEPAKKLLMVTSSNKRSRDTSLQGTPSKRHKT